ncbi:hypothetical protein BV25DRAFT_237395 [Artomyces pyxidatus]|uniref:Uncharacterized protein n=1 Tax=Artomyces pyxidatus TaxID=48021 RepID=A0ACB8T6Q8_9AGAM|nr:hypothetical protein BV25DRAFT_237395 [Artomyces pyxidatus]
MRRLPSFAFSHDIQTLTLEKALQAGAQWQSQVWVASVAQSPGASNDARREHVVVKFLQPSMLCIPHTGGDAWMADYVPPRTMALSEDCIYRTLRPVRGSAVPHYFGLHQVQMPNREHAWMLVLEHIEGITIDEWRRSKAHRQDATLSDAEFVAWIPILKDLSTMILRCLAAVHAQNVFHKDIRRANLIIHRPSSGPTQVVVIDFGFAVTPIPTPDDVDTDKNKGLSTLRCCRGHYICIKAFTADDLQGLTPPHWYGY